MEDAAELSVANVLELIDAHLVPGSAALMRRVGFDRRVLRRAEGMNYFDDEGRAILDFFAGFGAMAIGHNHPRVTAARRYFADNHLNDMSITFPSPYVAALSHNLAALSPEGLDVVMLCQSGSEANELALRLTERVGGRRNHVAYACGAFHGKTRGALSVTDEEVYRRGVMLLPGRVRVPFGDADALEAAFRRDPRIGSVILETIQGGAGIVLPPPGYLKEVRRLCDYYGVLWIADEVQCGLGRTGRFYAFEHDDVVPDVVTLAKALGGGKAPVGAVIARRSIFEALPRRDAALMFGPSTFAWFGENCATAIESLNVIVDEHLVDRAAKMGDELLTQLIDLHDRFPGLLVDVRGRGLMIGAEFASAPPRLRRTHERLSGALSGPVGALLFHQHDVLVGFTAQNRDVLRLEPPLILDGEHVHRFCGALTTVLEEGRVRIARNFLAQRSGRARPRQ